MMIGPGGESEIGFSVYIVHFFLSFGKRGEEKEYRS
jgi:hypothetical protein